VEQAGKNIIDLCNFIRNLKYLGKNKIREQPKQDI